jgi:hypothetical protein
VYTHFPPTIINFIYTVLGDLSKLSKEITTMSTQDGGPSTPRRMLKISEYSPSLLEESLSKKLEEPDHDIKRHEMLLLVSKYNMSHPTADNIFIDYPTQHGLLLLTGLLLLRGTQDDSDITPGLVDPESEDDQDTDSDGSVSHISVSDEGKLTSREILREGQALSDGEVFGSSTAGAVLRAPPSSLDLHSQSYDSPPISLDDLLQEADLQEKIDRYKAGDYGVLSEISPAAVHSMIMRKMKDDKFKNERIAAHSSITEGPTQSTSTPKAHTPEYKVETSSDAVTDTQSECHEDICSPPNWLGKPEMEAYTEAWLSESICCCTSSNANYFYPKPTSDNPIPNLHRTQRPSSPVPRWLDTLGHEQDTEAWLAAHPDFSADYPDDRAN